MKLYAVQILCRFQRGQNKIKQNYNPPTHTQKKTTTQQQQTNKEKAKPRVTEVRHGKRKNVGRFLVISAIGIVGTMPPAETEVMVSQLCLMCGSTLNCQTLCLGARPRYSLVVDEDVKKPTNQPNQTERCHVGIRSTIKLKVVQHLLSSCIGAVLRLLCVIGISYIDISYLDSEQ